MKSKQASRFKDGETSTDAGLPLRSPLSSKGDNRTVSLKNRLQWQAYREKSEEAARCVRVSHKKRRHRIRVRFELNESGGMPLCLKK